MASLLDEYQLNKDTFERLIVNAMTMKQICIIFRKTDKEMDEWCIEEYHTNFQTTYDFLRQIAIDKFTDTLRLLGLRGNQTALNIMNNLVNNNNKEQTVRIVFDSSVPEENEKDKEV